MESPFSQAENSSIGLDIEHCDPWEVFEAWLADAKISELNDPNAMFLATVDQSGMPNVRTVLMKFFDRTGVVFYTNLASTKGIELKSSQTEAICFHWKSLKRQVRLRGNIEPVSAKEADDYFGSRARTSQLGAWASKQSRSLKSRHLLFSEVAKYAIKFGVRRVPRPEHSSGFRLVPYSIEFCQEGQYRLHERYLFSFDFRQNRWSPTQLQP